MGVQKYYLFCLGRRLWACYRCSMGRLEGCKLGSQLQQGTLGIQASGFEVAFEEAFVVALVGYIGVQGAKCSLLVRVGKRVVAVSCCFRGEDRNSAEDCKLELLIFELINRLHRRGR